MSHILHYNTFKTTKFLRLYLLMIDKVALIDIMVILWTLQFLFELLLIILYYISRIFLPGSCPRLTEINVATLMRLMYLAVGDSFSINALFYGSIIWHTSIRCFFFFFQDQPIRRRWWPPCILILPSDPIMYCILFEFDLQRRVGSF